jgi:agmatine deiminase
MEQKNVKGSAAKRSKAKRSKAKRSKAKRSKAKRSKAKRSGARAIAKRVTASTAGVASSPTPFAEGYVMPAEWEPHLATWLAWPHEQSDWPGKFEVIPWVFAELIRVLTRGERVRLLVRSAADRKQAQKFLTSAGVDLERVDFVTATTDRSWTRDFVPSFVVRRGRTARNQAKRAAVRFRFDGWRRYPNHKNDVVAGGKALDFLDLPRFEPIVTLGQREHHVILEGGAIDVDGEGTLLATEECLLDGKQARNPELGRGLTEQVLRDFLGAEKVIWLGRGIAGDDTGGHIDDFARFVAPGRVVVAQELERRDPNHRVLAEALERLRGARDARGRRLDIVPLPMPAPIAFRGQRLPASYANFYVASHAVLVPTFNDPNDHVALGIFADLFPGREIVGIYSRDLVLGLGTLHCSTQQEPAPA